MSLPVKTLHRLPKIKQGLREGLNRDQIAEQCGVTEKTIDRDMNAWVESGQFETWLKREYVDLYHYVKTANPTVAFKELSKVLGKMVTRKAEIKADTTITKHEEVNVTVTTQLRDYEKTIRAAVERDFQLHNTKQPIHTTQADTKTS